MAAKTAAPHRKMRNHALNRREKRHLKVRNHAEVVERTLSWAQVEVLVAMVNLAIYQSNISYDAILVISRGGLVPGCLLAQGFENKNVLPVAIDRYHDKARESHRKPQILYFPEARAFRGKKVLVIDDVWDFGDSFIVVERALLKCKPTLIHSAALIFKPTRNRHRGRKPDFYAEETADWVKFPWETYPKRVLATMVAHFSKRNTA